MVVDVEATVLSNVRLSDEYNVLKLEVPEIAAQTQPGQFLMVKPEMGPEPLLRRPFSIFEILHDREGNPKGISLLNKRVGIATDLLFHKQPGSHMMCLGPLGQPYKPVCPPTEAWMVAGGVGLAPFATLSYALSKQQTISTLFYGARHGGDIFCLDIFERLGIQIVLATEDGSRGENRCLCLRSNSYAQEGGHSGQKLRTDMSSICRAGYGVWAWWLLQLCNPSVHGLEEPQLCSFLYRRPRVP